MVTVEYRVTWGYMEKLFKETEVQLRAENICMVKFSPEGSS